MAAPTKEKTNRLGLTREDYKGSPSTLCPGCGHNSITNHLQMALFQYGLDPTYAVKFSGIGCSSKTPSYFMNRSHGFNSVHGRMPSVATGTLLANGRLTGIGISGDGDTAAIGIGQFVHLVRRNVKLVYVIENNGVYGLTKGQFSPTADVGSLLKSGESNPYEMLDCCKLAITLGCAYVARSFSGDSKQLVPLIEGAFSHRGTAVLDVISPCVTFNDHEGSTRSYDWVKEHDEPVHEVGFVPACEPVEVPAEAGPEGVREVALHDGSKMRLVSVGKDYDPTDRIAALQAIEEAGRKGVLLTGLLYYNPGKPDLHDILNLVDTPLAALPEEALKPSRAALDEIMEALK